MAFAQDDYATASSVTFKPNPDSLRATSVVSDTISAGKKKKSIGSGSDIMNYINSEERLQVNSELSPLSPTFKKEIFRQGKRHKTTELKLDLTVVVFTLGSKVVCYDTRVSITFGGYNLGLAFDEYELHLKKSEPIGTLDLFNPYPNRPIKLVNDSHQEYYMHCGLTESGWMLVLYKGLKGEESIFLSNNNPACIRN